MIWQIVQSVIRHSLTSIGAVVISKGLASSSDTDVAVGAVMTLIGFGHSLWVKWKSQPPTSGPQPGNRIPILFFAIASVTIAFSVAGCTSGPQRIAYDAAGTTVVTVDTAMNAWGNYVGLAHPSTNEEIAVENGFEKYQASMAVVCDAGAAYAATGGTNATATAALNQAIVNSSQDLADLETMIETFGVQLQ